VEGFGIDCTHAGPTDTMKLTDRQKDFLASIGVGLLSMILLVLAMGTIVLWGQSAGEKVRAKLTAEQTESSAAETPSDGSTSR